MKKFDDLADRAESEGLEFPDWSGMDDSSARVTPDAAFLLCERYRAWFPGLAEEGRSQSSEKCLVEFVL
jgi:hypothetical protein